MSVASDTIVIIGKPNCGKSLLFNRLTGLSQKVANFPGVTVEVKSGGCGDLKIIDFPGVYSLNPLSQDETIAVEKFRQAIDNPAVKVVVCVFDSTRLERSLVLGLQAQELAVAKGKTFIVALNMIDELYRRNQCIDVAELSRALQCRVFSISARTGQGLQDLKNFLQTCAHPQGLESTPGNLVISSEKSLKRAREIYLELGPKADILLKSQNRVDDFLLSGFWGGVVFLLTMVFLFQAIFTWATPLMDAVEAIIGAIGGFVSTKIPAGIFADFLNDAIFGGLGSFLVFVPQIFVLTFMIGILEDSGYLARAAIICHRPLSFFGLSGRSFVPLLSAHACAIPAIMAARTIESPRHRLLTILAIPLMSCSARLPVYALFISALIPPITFFGGTIGLQGLCFTVLYVFGLLVALIVTSIVSRHGEATKITKLPFVIELPPYRLPNWSPLFQRALDYSKAFIRRAGPVIFGVSVVVWFLGYFPHGSGHLQESFLGDIGHFIEPIFAPLGIDWRFSVAIIASFVAREVFVGTLGTLFNIDQAEDRVSDLASQLSASGLTVASGVALLVFYVIALQCASTLAVIKQETGSRMLPVVLFFSYGILAYLLAFLTHSLLLWI